jgi:hypothetical protein
MLHTLSLQFSIFLSRITSFLSNAQKRKDLHGRVSHENSAVCGVREPDLAVHLAQLLLAGAMI